MMELTPEQILQFREQGYVALPQFWDERETEAMQAEVERLKRYGLLRNVATEGDGTTEATAAQNLQICPISPQSHFFRALPYVHKVIAAVSALIGDPVLLHLDQIFLKPGKQGSGTNWHQDNAYFQIPDPLQGTAMWSAVHEATVANGTLHVIPGSFREVYEHTRDPYSNHHIRCFPPEDRAVPVELPAGGVVFFAYGTAHCTRDNTTDKERAGVALHFLNGAMEDQAHGGFPIGKRPYLTGEYADGGDRVYGTRVADSWHYEVERVLAASQML